MQHLEDWACCHRYTHILLACAFDLLEKGFWTIPCLQDMNIAPSVLGIKIDEGIKIDKRTWQLITPFVGGRKAAGAENTQHAGGERAVGLPAEEGSRVCGLRTDRELAHVRALQGCLLLQPCMPTQPLAATQGDLPATRV